MNKNLQIKKTYFFHLNNNYIIYIILNNKNNDIQKLS